MSTRLLLACTLLFALACGSGDAPAPTVEVAPPTPATAAEPKSDREAFIAWFDAFKTAAEAKDYDALAAMSADPVTTRGPMDWEPEIPFDKAAFPVFAKHFFAQNSSQNIGATVLDDLGNVDWDRELGGEHRQKELAEGRAWIHNMKFRKIDGAWQWHYAYTEDGVPDAIAAELGTASTTTKAQPAAPAPSTRMAPASKPSTRVARPGASTKRTGSRTSTKGLPKR